MREDSKGASRLSRAWSAVLFLAAIAGLATAFLTPATAWASSAEDSLTLYYSDSTYTTVVGRVRCICGESCRYSGIQTPWDRVVSSTPCGVPEIPSRCYLVLGGVFYQVTCPQTGMGVACSVDGGQTFQPCQY